jgi:hypothetical protein
LYSTQPVDRFTLRGEDAVITYPPEQASLFNPYHDEMGRFASKTGAADRIGIYKDINIIGRIYNVTDELKRTVQAWDKVSKSIMDTTEGITERQGLALRFCFEEAREAMRELANGAGWHMIHTAMSKHGIEAISVSEVVDDSPFGTPALYIHSLVTAPKNYRLSKDENAVRGAGASLLTELASYAANKNMPMFLSSLTDALPFYHKMNAMVLKEHGYPAVHDTQLGWTVPMLKELIDTTYER